MTFLEQLLKEMASVSLEAVLVGNAAGALHGAPVTTLDVDFMIRDTDNNIAKLHKIASKLEAYLSRPFEPASNMMRLLSHEIQADFLFRMDGVKSFESIKSRACLIEVGSQVAVVAALEDVIKSKKAAHLRVTTQLQRNPK
jgi:hypothetical protein